MATFLFKTEPSDYSWDDLKRDGRTVWDGVANNAALLHLRTARQGDEALIYHTGTEKRIAGLAKIVSAAYADPQRPGDNARGEPKFAVVDVEPMRPAARSVTLAEINADDRFADFALVRQPRLSVMPTPAKIDASLRKMAGL